MTFSLQDDFQNMQLILPMILLTTQDFNVIRNDSSDKFQSTAFCHRSELGLIDFQGSPAVALLKIRKYSFTSKLINVLLIYRKQSWIITLIL